MAEVKKFEVVGYDLATGEPYRAVYVEHVSHTEIRPWIEGEDEDAQPAPPAGRERGRPEAP